MSDGPATHEKPPHPLADAKHRRFLLRKLHSLSGVVPVGAFLVMHLFTNAKALGGREPFDHAVADINNLPFLPALEAGILVPLLFHAGYGVKLALEARHNVRLYPTSRNWAFTLQRVTGLVAFAFIAFHLWQYRVQKLLGKLPHEHFYQALSADLSTTVAGVPVFAVVYVLGVAACAYHFANGLFGFCTSWGITQSRRSQRLAGWAFAGLGAVLFFLGANTTLYFATGARFFVPSGPENPFAPKPPPNLPLPSPAHS